jgi:hypothetical protein
MANIASLKMIAELDFELRKLHNLESLSDTLIENSYAFTIYADDIQISTNNRFMIQYIIVLVNLIADKHGFKINKNKTRVRSSIAGYRKILGINVGNDHIRATRKTMRKIRAADHQGNYQSKGGLVAWSKCYHPKKHKQKIITNE